MKTDAMQTPTLLYILDSEGSPTPCPDPIAWSDWMQIWENRLIGKFEMAGVPVVVTTVFLGVLDCVGEKGQNRLFGSLVRRYGVQGYEVAYSTKAEALEGHQKLLDDLIASNLNLASQVIARPS